MTTTSAIGIYDPLTKAAARKLTDRINATAACLWQLLVEAYERRAWEALGYESWRVYATTEFQMSQSHIYRLLDQGRVIRALEAAEREARDIKPHIEIVAAEIKERVSEGAEPVLVVKDAIREARKAYFTNRKKSDLSNRIVEHTSLSMLAVNEGFELIDFDALDSRCVEQWSRELRVGIRHLTWLAKRLDEQAKKCRHYKASA